MLHLHHDSIMPSRASGFKRGGRRDENQEEHAGDAVDGASTINQSARGVPAAATVEGFTLCPASSVEQVENELPRRRGSGRMDRRPSAAAAAGQLAEDSSADTLDLK